LGLLLKLWVKNMATNNIVNTPFLISGSSSSYPTQHGILTGSGTNTVSATTLNNGQLLIGSTSNAPVAATLTAGTGISITNGAGTITIDSTAGGRSWTSVATSTQALTSTGGYLCNNGSTQIVFTLPSTASSTFGDNILIKGFSSGGWRINQNASQQIWFIDSSTTAGTGGNIVSNNRYDTISLTFLGTLGGIGTWSVDYAASAGLVLT